MRRCFSARASGLGRSVPACGERFAGMRGFEAVEAGEGAGPGEIGGEGPDFGGGHRSGGQPGMTGAGADQAQGLAPGDAEPVEQRRLAQ